MFGSLKVRVLAAIIAANCLMFATFSSEVEAAKITDKVEAVVNNGVILESELNANIEKYRKKIKASLPPGGEMPDEKIIKRQALDHLIDDLLIVQLSKKMGLKVSDMEADQIIEVMAKENKLTVNQLYERSFKEEGFTPLEFREEAKRQILLNNIKQLSVRNRLKISNQEIEQTMEKLKAQNNTETQYHIHSIFVRVSDSASPEETAKAEELAKDIVSKLKKGENFSTLARKYDNGPKSMEGGDWGYVSLDSMPTIFLENISDAKVGDLIGPRRTESGYLILKIEDIKGTVYKPDIKIKTRHILIKPTIVLSDEQVVEKLKNIKRDIENNTIDFPAAARKYSEDPGTSVKGGELDWASPKIFDPVYAHTALSLNQGEISDPIKSMFGWHIVQLMEKKVDADSNSELRDRAYEMLFMRRYNDELILWLNELRNNSYIKILDPEITSYN